MGAGAPPAEAGTPAKRGSRRAPLLKPAAAGRQGLRAPRPRGDSATNARLSTATHPSPLTHGGAGKRAEILLDRQVALLISNDKVVREDRALSGLPIVGQLELSTSRAHVARTTPAPCVPRRCREGCAVSQCTSGARGG
jgi:hypothetical protein